MWYDPAPDGGGTGPLLSARAWAGRKDLMSMDSDAKSPFQTAELAFDDPFAAFSQWMGDARGAEPNDPNAMTLATVSSSGVPSARIVLLRSVDAAEHPERGFVFFTNTESRKGMEIAANPQVALLFHWKSLGRQIRIEGKAIPVAAEEAESYFHTRPRISRLGARASDQSRPLPDRKTLQKRVEEEEARYPGDDIPRPAYWSGYRVTPTVIEFWQQMPFRLHDRLVFRRQGKNWGQEKLYP
ncbi:Pyridoxamine 5'-phosphate oxidase [Granulibacter bethesdensis]|nr:Pyridoxamine 5'-phosphate oxidase [Granulibacter bethesdensis]